MNHESNKWIRFFSIYHNIMFFSSCLCARLIGCCLLGFKLIFHYCIQQLVKNFISSRSIGSDFFLYVSQLIGFSCLVYMLSWLDIAAMTMVCLLIATWQVSSTYEFSSKTPFRWLKACPKWLRILGCGTNSWKTQTKLSKSQQIIFAHFDLIDV